MDSVGVNEEQNPSENELQTLAVPVPAKTIPIWGNTIREGDKFILPAPASSSSSSSSESEESSEERRQKSTKRQRPSWRDLSHYDDDNDDDDDDQRNDEEGACGNRWQWFGIFLAIGIAVGGALFYQPLVTPSFPQGKLPLWLSPHATKSEILNTQESYVRPLVVQMSEAFAPYLGRGAFECLCMYHFHTTSISNRLYQICGTSQIRGPLVNPELVGRGNETDYWSEQPIASIAERRARYRTIWLRWHDVATGQQMYGRFDGAVAACLQLAMDEMNGK